LNILVNDEHHAIITDFGSARIVPRRWPSPNREARNTPTRDQQSLVLRRPRDGENAFSETNSELELTGPMYTVRWVAPEVLLEDSLVHLSSDVWAFGWLCWEIMTGNIPYQDISEAEGVIEAILAGQVPAIEDSVTYESLRTLVSRCWSVDPAERPAAEECRGNMFWMPRVTPARILPSSDNEAVRVPEFQDPLRIQLAVDPNYDSFHNMRNALEVAYGQSDSTEIAPILISLGEAYSLHRNYADSETAFTKARDLYTWMKDDAGIGKAATGQALAYSNQGEFNEAEACFYESIEIASRLGTDAALADAIHGLGTLQERRGKFEEAVESYQQAQTLYTIVDNALGLANANCGLARIHRMRCRLDPAEQVYADAISRYDQLGHSFGVAGAKCGLGEVCLLKGKHSEAEELYQMAVDIFQRLDDPCGAAKALCGLGNVQITQGRNTEAISTFLEVEGMQKRIQDPLAIAEMECKIGDFNRSQGYYTKAEVAYGKAQAIYKHLEHGPGTADTLCGLGQVRRAQGRAEEAEDLFNRSRTCYVEMNHGLGIANTDLGLAALCIGYQDFDAASSFLEEAVTLYTRASIPASIERAQSLMTLTERLRGPQGSE
ncbi:hypothetical protein FRB90_001278, partial [Tulasnella sp. 427]